MSQKPRYFYGRGHGRGWEIPPSAWVSLGNPGAAIRPAVVRLPIPPVPPIAPQAVPPPIVPQAVPPPIAPEGVVPPIAHEAVLAPILPGSTQVAPVAPIPPETTQEAVVDPIFQETTQEAPMDPIPPEAMQEGAQEAVVAPIPRDALVAPIEKVVDPARKHDLWFIDGRPSRANPGVRQDMPVPKGNHEEDGFVNNHTSVWGSWQNDNQLGYKCCQQTVRNSYCTRSAGIMAAETVNQTTDEKPVQQEGKRLVTRESKVPEDMPLPKSNQEEDGTGSANDIVAIDEETGEMFHRRPIQTKGWW